MTEFLRRSPEAGDSLRRPDPHLIPPDELVVGAPAGPSGPRRPLTAADILRAHGHFAEEPATGLPPVPRAPAHPSVVRVTGSARTGGTPLAPTGHGTARAAIGDEHTTGHVEGGIDTRRTDAGAIVPSARAGGGVRVERPGFEAEVGVRGRGLGDRPEAEAEGSIRVGTNRANVTVAGGAEHLGTDHAEGTASATGQVGRSSGPHGTLAVRATELGGEAPRVTTRVGASAGPAGPRGALTGGVTLGEHPTGTVGAEAGIGPENGANATLRGTVNGIGGRRVTGSAGIEGRVPVGRNVVLRGGASMQNIGGTNASGRVNGGVTVGPVDVDAHVEGNGSGVTSTGVTVGGRF